MLLLATKRTVLCLLSVMLMSAAPLFAVGGKIAGTVLDKETKQPLPGVNVIVEGTTLGAATNLKGEYVILNVPSGKYTLRASLIGYSTIRVENLRVSVDNTTRQDFGMASETLEGQEVVVIAERPLVQKDLTATQNIKTAEEIKELPVESFIGVLTTQAGVNTGADGAIHIRGGRSNEIGYYIDGVPVVNPFFTNGLANNVSNKAVEELKVISGAFNAEYGNAMSGIVNIQIKEGGSNYKGSFSAYTGDYLSTDKGGFYNIDDVNPFSNYVLEGTLNGPVPLFAGTNKLTFNLSGRYDDNGGYLYGIREHLPSDSAAFPPDGNWYIETNGDSAFVPMNPRRDYNLIAKLTYRLSAKIKLSSQILYDGSRYKSYVHAYRFNPDGTYNYDDDSYNYSLKLNHAFTKSFYEANFFYATTKFRQFVYEDPLDLRYVSTTRISGTPNASFVFGGTQMGHVYRDSKSWGGKIDFTSQVTTQHELKTGVSFRLDNLNEENITVIYDGSNDFPRPTITAVNSSPSHTFYEKDALQSSAYLQDKIEYADMIINAGVRYDRFDPNSDYLLDLLDPEAGPRAQASVKQRVSPRLGVAFPITDRGVLHFSYGHFYQMPSLRNIYGSNIAGAGGFSDFGYADLRPEKTINYEFGLQQQLGTALAVELSLFSKDIRDLIAIQTIRYQSLRFGPKSYNVFLNRDYGAVKGFTLSFTKRHDPQTKLSAWVDYTFQTADGNAVRDGAFFFSAISGIEEEKQIVPLTWDQRHVLNTTVTLSEPNNWGVSFIAKLSSGWPHTPNIPNANYVPITNSGNKPWQKNVDLRVFKNLRLSRLDFVFFAKVFNVFDTRNERFVFDDTGRADYTFVNRSNEEFALLPHYGEPGVHTWSEYQTRPNYYSTPRAMQLGLSLEF